MKLITEWFQRVFADRQAMILVIILALGTAVILLLGKMLAPVIAGAIIAYLLEGVVRWLERRGVPRIIGVSVVFLAFCAFVLVMLFGLAPLIYRQLNQLVQLFPTIITKGQDALMQLPQNYPRLIDEEQVNNIALMIRREIASLGQNIVSWSLASVVGFITIIVYLVLVPLLVFFFLKDKDRIVHWFRSFLPSDYSLASQVWSEVDLQIGNYVRGKFWEILIVWSMSTVAFTFLGLQFAVLLGLMVGVSVLVPYIGAAVVTLPVAVVGFTQWGWSSEFIWLMGAYGVIQFLDGNILVPLLFSEVVDLHPIAIIVAVLAFGGVWGFWGVFFAIPLATLVQAVLKAWPAGGHARAHGHESQPDPPHAEAEERDVAVG
jgi:putative permease